MPELAVRPQNAPTGASPSDGQPRAVASPAGGVDDPDRWVAQHGDALLRYALLRVDDPSTAEDLVQETLLAAWRGRARFDHRSAFRTWLIGILKTRIADFYRRAGRERLTPLPPAAGRASSSPREFDRHGVLQRPAKPWPATAIREAASAAPADCDPGRSAEAAEFWDVVARCTADMPGHLGRVFQMKTLRETQSDAICEQEGITAKNLSVRLHRARMLLRRCLEQKWFCDSGH